MIPAMKLISRMTHEPETPCWNFSGCLTKEGYGQVRYNGRTVYAHRLAAHVWLGFDLESPLLVCHSCDNPRCFCPWHLFPGTHTDNARDAIAKGRDVRSAPRTMCRRGLHPLEAENARPLPNGRKQCRECALTRQRSRRQ